VHKPDKMDRLTEDARALLEAARDPRRSHPMRALAPGAPPIPASGGATRRHRCGQTLPTEMGCGSGSTCWRRRKEWQYAGAWERLHRILLNRLGEADRIDWERTSLDSASVAAKREARTPARTRRIRAKTRHKASSPGGPPRCTAGGYAHWSEYPRLDRLRGIGGRRGADQASRQRPSPQATGEAARRQSVQQQELPRCSERA